MRLTDMMRRWRRRRRRRRLLRWDAVVCCTPAFAKIRRPDERFVALNQYIVKLDESLTGIERLEVRIAKRHSDMIQEMADVGSTFALLSGTEVLGGEALEAAGRVFDKSLAALRALVRASVTGGATTGKDTVGA